MKPMRHFLILTATLALSTLASLNPVRADEESAGACENLSQDRARSSSTSGRLKSCCARAFREASASARAKLEIGNSRFVAAGFGKLLCIDEWALPTTPEGKPKWVRRNAITGPNAGLSAITAVSFVAGSSRPQILVADGEERPRVVTFNYRFDGNVYPEREYRSVGVAAVHTIALDEDRGNLILLGRDGRVRRVSLSYNDRGLREEERCRVDAETTEAEAVGEPFAMSVSRRLGKALILDTAGKLTVLPLRTDWKREAIETTLDTGVHLPSAFRVVESEQGEVRAEVIDSVSGSSHSSLLSVPSAAESPLPSSGSSGK